MDEHPGPRVNRAALPPVLGPSGVPPLPDKARPGAYDDLSTINVLTSSLMAAGTEAAWGDPRPRFEMVAWVRRMEDRQDVWVDLYLALAGQPSQHTLLLDYIAPAGSGGDLFRLNLSFPPRHPLSNGLPDRGATGIAAVIYRLYCRTKDRLYTDGILHATPIADLLAANPPQSHR